MDPHQRSNHDRHDGETGEEMVNFKTHIQHISDGNLSVAETLLDPRQSTPTLGSTTDHSPRERLLSPSPKSNNHENLKKLVLKQSKWDLTLDIVLSILPGLFVALGCFSLVLNNEEAPSRSGDAIVDFSKLSGTLYPIVFAAIVSRFLQKISRWRAERGTTIGFLETLNRSQSFASSITTAASLHMFNLTSALVLIIWLLSPVGGQSSLRVLSRVQDPTLTNTPVYFADSNYTGYWEQADNDWNFAAVNGVFRASLLSPSSTQKSPLDIWHHPKVPFATPNATLVDPADNAMWSATNGTESYSSLIGIPLLGIPSTGNLTFTMPWTVTKTPCTRTNINYQEYCSSLNDTLEFDGLVVNFSDPYSSYCNVSDDSYLINFFNTSWDDTLLPDNDQTPEYLNFSYIVSPFNRNYSDLSKTGLVYTCQLHSFYYNVTVSCSNADCVVTQLNQSATDHRPPWANLINQPLDTSIDPSDLYDNFQIVLENLNYSVPAYSTPRQSDRGSVDPDTSIAYFFGLTGSNLNQDPSWDAISSDMFSQQMSVVWNTYFAAVSFYSEATQDSTTDIDSAGLTTALNNNDTDSKFWRASGQWRTTKDVYKAEPVWVTLLLGITVILELCAILSLIISRWTLAPDILGYVSSLTRDSPHFDHIRLNSTLHGDALAYKLRDVKVQIADIQSDEEVGKVALVCTDGQSQGAIYAKRLTKDKTFI